MVVAMAGLSAAGCVVGEEEIGESTSDLTTYASVRVKPAGFKYEFDNWDHDGPKVDNPVSIIFVSDKPDLVDRVYSQVESQSLRGGGSKMRLTGIGGSRPGVNEYDPWHSDSAGRKGAFGCWGKCDPKTNIHIRTYGPNGRKGTQVYQGSFGVAPYYLLATVHFDRDENTPKADFGYQDEARRLLVERMVAAKKWRVIGSVDVKNACNGRMDRTHLCQHDGTATLIEI